MSYSISAASALVCLFTCTKAARIAGLRVRSVRYSAIQISRNLFHTKSSSLQNQPFHTSRYDLPQSSQFPDHRIALASVENSRQRKGPFHCNRNGALIRAGDPKYRNEDLERAAQTAKTSLASWDSLKARGYLKSLSSSKGNTSFEADYLSADVKDAEQLGVARAIWQKDPRRGETGGSSKVAGLGRKARLRDDSPKTVKMNKGAVPLSQSTKAAAHRRTSSSEDKGQREQWQIQKSALSQKFGSAGWLPRKRLSPNTLEGIQFLHAQFPEKFTTPILAEQFKVSPESIRRILKSKWQPTYEEQERRRQRWEKRGENIWSQMVEVGIKPPKKWREMGVGKLKNRTEVEGEQLGTHSEFESGVKSSILGQPTANPDVIPTTSYRADSLVLLADRIL